MEQKWDRHAIKAELARRGYTLTGLAIDNGLPENACRRALSSSCLAGAEVIAKALGVTVKELWPDRYLRRQRKATTKRAQKASPKRDEIADRGAAA